MPEYEFLFGTKGLHEPKNLEDIRRMRSERQYLHRFPRQECDGRDVQVLLRRSPARHRLASTAFGDGGDRCLPRGEEGGPARDGATAED